jgi:hypothetical protein
MARGRREEQRRGGPDEGAERDADDEAAQPSPIGRLLTLDFRLVRLVLVCCVLIELVLQLVFVGATHHKPPR